MTPIGVRPSERSHTGVVLLLLAGLALLAGTLAGLIPCLGRALHAPSVLLVVTCEIISS